MRENQIETFDLKLKRRKRQAGTSINCAALQIQLQNVTDEIAITQIKIQNSTTTLNTLQNQVKIYETRVNTTTGSAQKTAKNLLTIYLKLVTATNTTLEGLKAKLLTLQVQQAQIQSDIANYCTPVNPANYPCGKLNLFKI